MKNKNGKHKYKIISFKGKDYRIDEEIAPLLLNMWKLGIKTWNSCQGMCSFKCAHKNYIEKKVDGIEYWNKTKTKNCGKFIWIVFNGVEDLELFYNLVAKPKDFNNDISMYSEMMRPNIWSITYPIINYGILGHWGRPKFGSKRSTKDCWIEDKCEKNNFIISPQLTFPNFHLPEVEQRIELALLNKKKK